MGRDGAEGLLAMRNAGALTIALRNRTLPGTDFSVSSQVLAGLNRTYPMEQQNGKYFTMFYGVFDTETRLMVHASGGHPPAIAIAPDGTATQLGSSGMMIGAFPFATYKDCTTPIAPGSKLFVFSDGCYEVFNPAGEMMTVADFCGVLAESATSLDALDRIVGAAQAWQQRAEFDDDFSLVRLEL